MERQLWSFPGAVFVDCRSARRSKTGFVQNSVVPFSPAPIACETLASLVARGAASWLRAPVLGADQPQSDVLADSKLADYADPQARKSGASEAIALIEGGRVYGDGIVLAPSGATVARDVSLDFGRTGEGHWLLQENKLRTPELIAGRVAVLATALGGSYAHWLLDELPRLISLRDWGELPDLITHAQAEFGRSAIKLAGFRGRVIEPVRRKHLQVDELIVPALPGWVGCVSAAHVQRLVNFTESIHVSRAFAPERIYISRALAKRRHVENESAVTAALAARGFTCVCLEQLSWEEQIRLFRGVKIVVAPHGAGLANLVFSRPGTRVIECCGREYVNSCFAQLSEACELDYTLLVAPGEGPWGTNPKSNRLDFSIDIEALRAVLGPM
jgi:hypothetical protein